MGEFGGAIGGLGLSAGRHLARAMGRREKFVPVPDGIISLQDFDYRQNNANSQWGTSPKSPLEATVE